MTEPASRADFPDVFKANFDAGRIDAVVSGYAENAVLDLPFGHATTTA